MSNAISKPLLFLPSYQSEQSSNIFGGRHIFLYAFSHLISYSKSYQPSNHQKLANDYKSNKPQRDKYIFPKVVSPKRSTYV